MKAQLEIITPSIAKQLLARNPINRRVSQTTVQRYAADMRAGLWMNNGQSVVVSIDGDLLDGQHRMHSVILSQQPTAMIVVRGAPREAFVTMDSGKARSLADLLSIQGHVHTNTLSAVARAAYSYIAGVGMSYKPTKATLDAFISQHPYTAQIASLVGNTSRLFPKAPLASILFLGNDRHSLDHEVSTFIDGVVHGEGLQRGDARHTLREWLQAERVRGRGVVRTTNLFAATGRAWNSYASGKELAVIKMINAPTQRSLPIFGFERSHYPDVPDLVEKAVETRRRNLAKANKPSLTAVA